MKREPSGAGFFAITAKGIDLSPKLLNTLLITPRDRHSKSELQLLKLMAALGITPALAGRRTGGGAMGAGVGACMAVCEGHGSLSSHCGTAAKALSGRQRLLQLSVGLARHNPGI